MLLLLQVRKNKTRMTSSFLSSRSSFITIPLLLLVLSVPLIGIILYILLQQQAIADTTKRTNATANTPPNTNLRNNNNSLATYNNPTFRITIQYPPSWEKVEEKSHGDRSSYQGSSSDKEVVKFRSPLEDQLDKYQESLIISVHILHHNSIADLLKIFDNPTSQRIWLHGFVLSRLTSLSTKLSDFKFIKSESSETILSGGNAAHKIVYMYREGKDDTTIKVMDVLMIKGDEGYIISYFSEPGKYWYYMPTIQKAIDSFQTTR
jgi:hypothetical protein